MNSIVAAALLLVCVVSVTSGASVDCKFKNGKGISTKAGIRRPAAKRPIECRDKCIQLMNTKAGKKVNGMYYDRKGGCYCLTEMRRIDEAKKFDKFTSCHLNKNEPNVLNNVPGSNGGTKPTGGEAVDLTYDYFRNMVCDEVWTKIGCYDVKEENRGRYLLNYRWDIEWEPTRFAKFAHSFACACAEAARINHVQFFATHYWGECWELEQEDLVTPSEGCILADGEYKNKCDSINEDGTCLGTSGFFVYTITPPDEDKKKRELEALRGIPKRDFDKKKKDTTN